MTSIEDDYEAEVSAEYNEAMFLRQAVDAANLGHLWDIAGWAPTTAIALKLAGTTEPARWITDPDDLSEVRKTDKGLIVWIFPAQGAP